jgi:ABC-type phosphate/phosphonate transport system substrate-binding protein
MLLFFSDGGYSENSPRLFIYDPTSPWQNMVSIREQFEGFLTLRIPEVIVEPYSDYEKFVQDVHQKEPDLIIIFSFHYLNLKDEVNLKPLSIATKKGKPFKTCAMLTNSRGESIISYRDGYIATLNFGKLTSRFLSVLFFRPNGLTEDNFSIIKTSKDIDSLFALNEGQVDLAVATKDQFKHLRKVSPWVVEGMRIIDSVEVPNILLCQTLPNRNETSLRTLIEAIENMGKKGSEILNRFGYDGWSSIDNGVFDIYNDSKE